MQTHSRQASTEIGNDKMHVESWPKLGNRASLLLVLAYAMHEQFCLIK